ncbi:MULTISPECIES: TIGR04282 family arsenosugar biosynthesis glycosyltransferase [unclassified Lentimonas]|uniref:TIGR04282 family arsenosugar biosynthesis glycosyltransferase n=1 Tax=unclassified Lentimonas TaxID=2630993 RepID=UPI0013256A93|nr:MULTISPECIES: TIGR04282 family arsenosugar biosynthesis glycosyltransferase [unclassified Lentimonas]CAA6678367.1 Unannotated [Lentimonas sp. CC4]CAA6685459.1 Unannotated [Lentimonas sp. CC6]CAA7076907.1 Unannotated [Lentimonas sp. CC4]CAA7170458.1 Unannotated [Lentimonas sp. CC21]CAA7179846.1 Unannotated [Lentimonas sp. CC8]
MSAILLFLKAPHRGHVKTRLAQTTGATQALNVYRALVERQFTVLPSHASIEVHYTPSDADLEMRQWLGHRHEYYPQVEGELGVKLAHSVSCAFERGAKSVCCIGGDCPQLDLTHFEQAQAALADNCDVVFGPCEDGGYYLIGLNAPQPELFKEIPWSSSNTLECSLQKAADLGLRVKLLETLYDIDEISELQRAITDGRLPSEIMDH